MDDNTRADLVALLKAAYPHPSFPDGPYERTADAVLDQLEASTWHTITLRAGLATLDARAGGDFSALEPEAAEQLLHEIADAEFFKFIRGVAVVSLYDDHEVWELLGYEGESYSQGGYVDRGFDDLDWLPAPRIEEYSGPEKLVAVAEHDLPKGAGR
jgi:hypothetical protein